LLSVKKRVGELLELLQTRAKQAPEQIGAVAGLLDRFGFASEVEEAYKAFVASNPSDRERPLVLASFLARHDRAKEAVTILDDAWETCRPELVVSSALPLFVAPSADQDIRRKVEMWVTEAIRMSPAAAASLRPELAAIYGMQERLDDAELLLRDILRGDPNHVKALAHLAWILALRDQRKAGEALELIDRAIDVEGKTCLLVDTRAVALIRSGQPNRAAQELRDAQAADPINPSLALHLAWAYQEAGESDLARVAFQQARALGLKPDVRDPLERSFIDRLRHQLATNEGSSASRH
jgi:predicted Zn-dependent protease